MAAGLGFKEFTTGDVLTAADANGYLASQVVMVFASAAARTSAITSPQEGMISYLKDTNSTEYYSGSAWAAIGGGGGKVLQVVSTTKTNTFTTTSSTATAITGLDVTITPSSTSSKILVLCFMTVCSDSSSGFPVYYLQRGATQILLGDAGQANQRRVSTGTAPHNNNYLSNANVMYLDSPSSTSALTYGMYTSTADSSGTVAINRTIVDGNNNYNARGTSTITVMEIGA